MRFHGKVYLVLGLLAAAIGSAMAATPEPFIGGVSYSPSGIVSDAQMQKGVPEAVIQADLERLRPITSRVRTYSVERGLDRIPAVARALGMKVSLGLWLGKDRAKNDAEIAHGIDVIIANADVIDRVFVGNETLERGDLTPAELIAYIQRVKVATKTTKRDIGTAETWSIWLKYPEIAAATDFVGVHLLPYWDGVAVNDAVAYEVGRYGQIAAAFPAKKIVIAETGWPSDGGARQAAVPSPGGQTAYIHDFLAQAKKAHYDFYIVEAFDQPWKAVSFESSVGPHWGLFSANRQPKVNLTN